MRGVVRYVSKKARIANRFVYRAAGVSSCRVPKPSIAFCMDDFAERDTRREEKRREEKRREEKRREERIVVVCVERTAGKESQRERGRRVLGKEIRVYRHRKNEIEGELEARSVSFGIQNAERSEERVERASERTRKRERA